MPRFNVFKTFIAGLLLGIAIVGGVLYTVPVVNQHREASIISVRTNGGNAEIFRISVPMDRILLGAAGDAAAVPPGLEWPDDVLFDDLNAEVFKLRNARDAVVGVASRVAASRADGGVLIEWVLHVPARGSAYVTMRPEALEGGYRSGDLRHGTREFLSLNGTMTERWVPARQREGGDETGAAGQGQIELEVLFVAEDRPNEQSSNEARPDE
ncbi:MAG: hypothetical protein AAFX56_03655 [Pseudomonadota bacterium]